MTGKVAALKGAGACALVTVGLVVFWPVASAAHDIPSDVTIQIFIKPDGQRLTLVARVPLITLNPQGAPITDVRVPVRGEGLLDFARVDEPLREAALALDRVIEVYENGQRRTDPRLVEVRVSLLSDTSFTSYEAAVAHVTGSPLPVDTQLPWSQGFFDAILEYAIESDRGDFSIDPKVEALGGRVTTVVRFLPWGGAVRAFQLHGSPGVVQLDPRWHQAALLFVVEGFKHILGGIDHLLFLLCLVLPFRRLRPLVLVVTSFTVAHSITLVASAYDIAPGGLWFPLTVEALIALSILYMALENIAAANLGRRWAITFGFGLVHGFGFSFALRDQLQFAGSYLLTSLLSFNVGVELGQLFVLAVSIPALALLFRYGIAERMGIVIVSALVAHTAWHWMVERMAPLGRVEWPAAEVLNALRWVLALAILAVLGRIALTVLRPRATRAVPAESAVEVD